MADEPTTPFDLAEAVIGLRRDGRADRVPQTPGRPPTRIDGYTIGAPVFSQPAPHDGEMHPDGDELLFLVSGRVSVLLDQENGSRAIELAAGQALIVPRGVWHRVVPHGACQLVHVTPGPRGEWRPLRGTGAG